MLCSTGVIGKPDSYQHYVLPTDRRAGKVKCESVCVVKSRSKLSGS